MVAAPAAPTLASKGEQVTKQQVLDRHKTRGLSQKDHIIPSGSQEAEGSRRKRKSKGWGSIQRHFVQILFFWIYCYKLDPSICESEEKHIISYLVSSHKQDTKLMFESKSIGYNALCMSTSYRYILLQRFNKMIKSSGNNASTCVSCMNVDLR